MSRKESRGAVHRQDLNRFSGKYNCHPVGLNGDTERILAAFRRHLAPFLAVLP